MIKLEIAKRNNNEFIIYGTLVLIMIILITIMVNVSLSENYRIPFGVLTIILGFTVFKITPNLGISKHSINGEIILNENSIEIRDSIEQQKIAIDKLKNVKVKITGYDGQSRTGSSYSTIGSNI